MPKRPELPLRNLPKNTVSSTAAVFLIQTWSQALYTVLTLLPGNTGNGLNVDQDRQQGEF